VDIDTFLSCFMPLTRLDLLQRRAAIFPLYRHPFVDIITPVGRNQISYSIYEVPKCCECESSD